VKRPNRHSLLTLAWLIALSLSACRSAAKAPPAPIVTPHPTLQVEGPPCHLDYNVPYYLTGIICFERLYDRVVTSEAVPELGGLALGTEGTLYIARPSSGTVWAMRDVDGDGFPDAPYQVASGLPHPTALTFHAGALYVAAEGGLFRLELDAHGLARTQKRLVADLTAPNGLWPDSVRVGPDGRVYVGVGASCADCPKEATSAGAVLSFASDGSDRRTVASGLRHPRALAFHPRSGDLWIADVRGPQAPSDALFRVPAAELAAGVAPNFGYPACVETSAPHCVDVVPPAYTFPDQSTPADMLFYTADGFPFWQDDLIVALAGSWDRAEPSGYALVVVSFDAEGLPDGGYERIAPISDHPSFAFPLARYSLMGMGFFPYHPVALALDPQGWLYIAEQEGRILRIRPRPAQVIDSRYPTPSPTP